MEEKNRVLEIDVRVLKDLMEEVVLERESPVISLGR